MQRIWYHLLTNLLAGLEPLEMLNEIEQLQDFLAAQTEQLRSTNQQLQAEITRRENLEAQLHNAKALLEQQVGLTTAQLVQNNATLQAEIREHRQAEQELERFFAINPTMLCVAGFDGYFKRLNAAFSHVLGWSEQQLRAEPFLHFVHPEDRQATIAEVEHLNQGEITISFENRYRCQDGSYRWLLWTATPYLEEQLIYAAARDITERKQAELALRRQHKQAQLLAQVMRKIRYSLRLEEILQTTVTEIQQLLTCDRVLIVQLQADGAAVPVSEAVLPQLPIMVGQQLTDPLLYGAYRQDYRQGRILAINNLGQTELQPETRKFLQQFAIQAKLIVPILDQKQLWGLLIAHQCHATRKWQNWEIELLQQLADQISIAISQAQLLNNQEQLVVKRTAQLTQTNQQLQQEIRDRKLIQVALTESQQTLAGILDTADEAIISIDQNQTIIIFNQGAEKIFGYAPEEIIGQPLDILLPQTFRQIHRQHVLSFGNSEETSRSMAQRSSTVFGRRRNGEEFPAEASISKLQSRDGLIFTVMLKDITQRQQAEQALRRSEKQLRLLTNALPVLIAYINAQQRYCFNNQAHESWFGQPCEQINGRYIWEVIGANTYHQIQDHVKAVLAGQSVAFEMELTYQNSSYRWVRASYVPDFELSGEVKGFFALFSDISEHKAIERVKSEFVSIVSHELRTPLTSIHGVLQLLDAGRLDKLSPSTQEMVNIALRNTDRLVRLINDVLDLERMESGRETMAKQSCNAVELVQQAVDTMQTMAQQHGVSLQIKVGKHKVENKPTPSPILLWADPDHILQTLTNLLSNAIKFSPQESEVWLSVEEQNSQLLFTVQDQGRGIPPDKLETVFERFQQVDASDSRQKGGTGLGLAICRHIVEEHRGKIWVESTVTEGSTFYFTLPAVREHNNFNFP